jgi:glycogen synthase
MKVLMFGWEFPPLISGGLGTACYRMTKALVDKNVEITFVVPNKYDTIWQNGSNIIGANETSVSGEDMMYINQNSRLVEKSMNMKTIRINSTLVPYIGMDDYYNVINTPITEIENLTSKTISHKQKRRFDFHGGYTQSLMEEVDKYALVAGQIAREQDFDVIHCHDWLTYKAGIVAKQISGKPLVVHVHATEYDRSGETVNPQVYAIEKMGMDFANKIVCVSNYTKRIVYHKYNQPIEKIFTVYNGINLQEREIIKKQNVFNKKIVTFLGRVTFQKGPDYFIEAADKVLKKDKNIIFVLAGKGDMLNRMIALVAKKRISENFFFTGFLQGKLVDEMFAMSDVYVMPSVSEPFGISPLEAMSNGVPTIISKQSGVSEIVSYALKVDFWDIDAMANAIYGLTHYPALSKMITRNAFSEIKKITWDKTADDLISIYKSLC